MITYKFMVRGSRKNTVSLRITNNRKSSLMSLGVSMTPDELDEALGATNCKRTAAARLILSCRLALEELRARVNAERNANISPSEVCDILRAEVFGIESAPEEPVRGTLLMHFEKFGGLRRSARTRQMYTETVKRIRACCSAADDLNFEDITPVWLSDFDNFMSRTSPSPNARAVHLCHIRAVMLDAFRNDMTTAHPFSRYRIAHARTRKRALSVQKLRALLSIEGHKRQRYIDMFKLIFYLVGINFVDLCRLSSMDEGRVYYVRAKTHRPYDIKVEPEAAAIIDKYRGTKQLLNYLDNCRDYRNVYRRLEETLHEVGHEVGVPELTSYWARHSWATIASYLDIPRETIAAALGHGGNTVTDIYIDFDTRKIDAANRRVIDYVLYSKE